jgi:hypothetical protein
MVFMAPAPLSKEDCQISVAEHPVTGNKWRGESNEHIAQIIFITFYIYILYIKTIQNVHIKLYIYQTTEVRIRKSNGKEERL